MATFCGVICDVKDEAAFYAKAAPLGVRKLRDSKGTITIDTSASSDERSDELARDLSTFEGVERAMSFFGQSAVDGYVASESVRGETVRRVVYNRDYGGWETSGTPRTWEKDWPVGRDPDEDDERYDEDSMDYGKLVTLVENLGWDFDAGAHAKFDPPGLFARLFSR